MVDNVMPWDNLPASENTNHIEPFFPDCQDFEGWDIPSRLVDTILGRS
jgi:hypothetical protein